MKILYFSKKKQNFAIGKEKKKEIIAKCRQIIVIVSSV